MSTTPRPWKCEGGSHWLTGPADETILHIDPYDNQWLSDDDSALILEAVNNYDRLRSIEEKARELAEHITGVAKLITVFGFDKPPDGKAWSQAVDKARDLLAAAGGE